MKSILSTAIIALLISGTASAQHGNLHSAFGIKAGMNIYNLNTDDNADLNTKIGFNAGLLGHIHLNKHIAMQPELVYSSQGSKYPAPGSSDGKIKLNYINIPVLFQYMFDNGFRIEAGPQVGFLVSAKNELGNVKTDIKDQFNTVDFGVGAGVSYVNPPTGLGIDARYNFGLTDIANVGTNKVHNRGAQVGVFYLIHRPKK